MREGRVAACLKEARIAKSGMSAYWERMRDYYDGTHDTAKQASGFLSAMDLPWIPAGVPDGYLHVESGIEADLPDFRFSARGENDDEKASLREKIVRYVLQNGDVYEKNAVNERRLNLYGSAVWKLAVSKNEREEAEIVIENPPLETVFPDPSATSLSECEYVAFVYHMSCARAERIFADDLARRGLTMADIFRTILVSSTEKRRGDLSSRHMGRRGSRDCFSRGYCVFDSDRRQRSPLRAEILVKDLLSRISFRAL